MLETNKQPQWSFAVARPRLFGFPSSEWKGIHTFWHLGEKWRKGIPWYINPWPNLYLVKVVGEGFTMSMMLAAHNLFLWKLWSAPVWTFSLQDLYIPLQWAGAPSCFMEPPRTWLPGFQVAQCWLLRAFHIWHTQQLAIWLLNIYT